MKNRSFSEAKQHNVDKRQFLLFSRKFIFAFTLAATSVSLIPERFFGPLNRFTAILVGGALSLIKLVPSVHGNLLTLNGFSVSIVSECSAIHIVTLYGTFIFAFPATRYEKWIGFAVGTILLLTINAFRIAAITIIGWKAPNFFELAHVYLGQLGMLIATIIACLWWCQWKSDTKWMDGHLPFLVRFLVFSSLLFFLWVPFNSTQFTS